MKNVHDERSDIFQRGPVSGWVFNTSKQRGQLDTGNYFNCLLPTTQMARTVDHMELDPSLESHLGLSTFEVYLCCTPSAPSLHQVSGEV